MSSLQDAIRDALAPFVKVDEGTIASLDKLVEPARRAIDDDISDTQWWTIGDVVEASQRLNAAIDTARAAFRKDGG